jgi:hypothetical protein
MVHVREPASPGDDVVGIQHDPRFAKRSLFPESSRPTQVQQIVQ